jgi:hypothetical protein
MLVEEKREKTLSGDSGEGGSGVNITPLSVFPLAHQIDRTAHSGPGIFIAHVAMLVEAAG